MGQKKDAAGHAYCNGNQTRLNFHASLHGWSICDDNLKFYKKITLEKGPFNCCTKNYENLKIDSDFGIYQPMHVREASKWSRH